MIKNNKFEDNELSLESTIERIDDARTYYGSTANQPKWSIIVLDSRYKREGRGLFNKIKLIVYDPGIMPDLVVGQTYRFHISIEGKEYIPKKAITNVKDVFNEVIINKIEKL